MPIKLTYEFVKEQFEKEGYTLLSTNYINNSTKLKYRCLEGHEHFITWNKWSQGQRCPYCSGRPIITIEQVRASFEAEGYTLLSTEYINNRTKLAYICSEGHTHNITWHDWSAGGYRCPHCVGKAKLTIEEIKRSFEKEDYVLLTTEYVNSGTKLTYICPFGHTHSISCDGWRAGRRCQTCGIIKNSGETHYNWRGGKTFEKYCAVWKDKEYKSDIRDRDGNCCLNPYCDSKDPNDLTIHHINYDKKDCHPKNLVTICRSCNARANTNRSWHTAWYQAVLTKRYSYSYGEYYENSN